MSVSDFTDWYWMQIELAAFARRLGLSAQGGKPVLTARIERHLRGREPTPRAAARAIGPRDSERPLRRATPVVHYKSDDATRAFFRAQIGPRFHFTWHLNQFRLARSGLTYGDLVDEWLAERERRRSGSYRAPIAKQGKWNRFVRAFFADPANRGCSLRDAARAWNVVKRGRGDHRYRRRR